MRKKIMNVHSELYFRGTMNDWNLNNEFIALNDNSFVVHNIKISKGVNEFKIADSNWSDNCNYSYSGNIPVMLYHNYSLTTSNNSDNITMIAHSDYNVDVFLKKVNNEFIMRMKIHSEKK